MDASKLIDQEITATTDWRGEIYKELRSLIHQADPDIVEEWKWNSAIFTHNGLVCSISPFKQHFSANFFKGGHLKDPDKLFNSGLDAKNMRTVKFFEGDKVDKPAFKKLVQEAVAFNESHG